VSESVQVARVSEEQLEGVLCFVYSVILRAALALAWPNTRLAIHLLYADLDETDLGEFPVSGKVATTESGVKSERYRCYFVWIMDGTGVSLNVCWIRYGGDSSARGSLTRSSAVARSFI
jgi:hypothetical protein